MKRVLLCFCVTVCAVVSGFAQPFVLEQPANVLKPGMLEAGISDLSYQADTAKFIDSAGNTTGIEIKTTGFTAPLHLRYAFCSKCEGILSVPYTSMSTKTDIPGTTASSSDDSSGFANPVLTGKMLVYEIKGWELGGAVSLALPAGEKKLKKGFDITPLVSVQKFYDPVLLNLNLSYGLTGEYDDANSVKRDPGNIFALGAGVEYPVYVMKTDLNLTGELVYQSLGDAKTAGVTSADSAGALTDLILGVRYNSGDVKTKFGFDISLGEEKTRSYDYKIIAGVTYLINL